MKKLILAAAAMAAGIAMADGITSTSVVGYNTITINKEYTLLTVNFDDVGGDALTIQKAFPYVEGMTEAKVSGSGWAPKLLSSSALFRSFRSSAAGFRSSPAG